MDLSESLSLETVIYLHILVPQTSGSEPSGCFRLLRATRRIYSFFIYVDLYSIPRNAPCVICVIFLSKKERDITYISLQQSTVLTAGGSPQSRQPRVTETIVVCHFFNRNGPCTDVQVVEDQWERLCIPLRMLITARSFDCNVMF